MGILLPIAGFKATIFSQADTLGRNSAGDIFGGKHLLVIDFPSIGKHMNPDRILCEVENAIIAIRAMELIFVIQIILCYE